MIGVATVNCARCGKEMDSDDVECVQVEDGGGESFYHDECFLLTTA